MAGAASLVSMLDVRTHLGIDHDDSELYGELQGFIDAAQPVIENIVGPVVQQTLTESYDGGVDSIVLRHGPVVSVTSVTEYRANTAFTLTAAADPTAGSSYSFYIDLASRRLVRRTSGGGTTSFALGKDAVKVVYVVGTASVPANIRLATLELIRHWYQQTRLGGRPQFGGDAMDESYSSGSFAIPNRVKELLEPNRRAPSIA